MTSSVPDLRGFQYRFDDGVILRVVDVKQRELEPWVTYETVYNNALPKREVVKVRDFLDRYGHLVQKV